MQKRTLSAPLIAMFGLLAMLALAPAAQATHVSPTFVAGNPSCADLGLTTITKFEPVQTETKSGIAMTKTGDFISFTSTVAIDAVIVKGGPNANVYSYAFDTFADSGLSAPDNGGRPYGLSHVEFCTDEANEPEPEPGIDLEKSVDKAVAYAGETLNYTLTVTNTGNTTLNGVDLGDELCDAEPVRSGANAGDTVFDAGDVWTYTCSYVVPTGTSEVENVAIVCYESSTPPVDVPAAEKCDEDTVTTPVESIGIVVVKDAVEQTAVAGTPVHFKISVTNTGTTTFTSYEFTDADCDEVRTGANAADTEFNPGDVWTYECEMPTAVGDVSAGNTAIAKGTDENGKQAQGQDDATVPLTQPGGGTPQTPGGSTPGGSTPGGSTPEGGGVLPETIVSGLARLRGPSGCVKQAFKASVRGRMIASVTFFVDGKLAKKFTGTRTVYSIKVNPRRYGFGRHRVVARVTFVAESGTKARRLPLTFRRCAQGTIAPRFTG